MVAPGKEGPEFMEDVVYRNLGSSSRRLLVRPGKGFDNSVISAGRGRVMILTVDPVSAIPSFGMGLSAWLSVHLIASDYTTSGADPEFAAFSYNFPNGMGRVDREAYVRAIGGACKEIGVSIAAGHTGAYPGADFTVIGAGAMMGFASKSAYVDPSMAREGDVILMTKEAAIEATVSLALSFPAFVERSVGSRLARKARGSARECTTVKDARAARRVGLGRSGVTSMHDATEGGVLGALEEMAAAADKRFLVDPGSVPVSPEARGVCGAFGIDPLTTMGEGSLIISCNPTAVGEVQRKLAEAGIKSSEIGKVKAGRGLWLELGGNRSSRFVAGPDPYWLAYERSLRRRLN